jgi:RNA-directed DNA polymerase
MLLLERSMLLDHISSLYQIPSAELSAVVRDSDSQYFKFHIPKRDGGLRAVLAPTPPLKLVQRWLSDFWISKLPVHPSAMAYRKGVSLLDNARIHQGSKYLLRMDYANFFPSLGEDDVKLLLEKNRDVLVDWSPEDIEFFLNAVLRRRRLSIGSSSSPALSNALCLDLDRTLYETTFLMGVSYSRYADDLFFSTSEPNVLGTVEKIVLDVTARLICPGNLSINSRKTLHTSRKGRMQVTGLLLTPDGKISIGRRRKRLLRAMVHQENGLNEDGHARLRGHLAYVYSVEPSYISRLLKAYPQSAVLQTFYERC